MTYLTDETFTYIINGADRDYNLSTPGTNYNNDTKYKNIFLSEDFAIHMGSYLDSSVEEYYCEVIQYVYNNYNDGKANTETVDNVNFTHLYSDIIEIGKSPNISTDKAKYPLTQPASTKNNTHNDSSYNGITRNNVNKRQINTFVCKNFNQKIKYFRLASMRSGENYGFIDVSSWAPLESHGNASLVYPYSTNLTKDGAKGNGDWAKQWWLKNFPHIIMYMTPIYKNKVPRLLNSNDAITLQISSLERSSGENDYGVDCIIPIDPINSQYKIFKAEFQSLDIMGRLNISKYERPLSNFPFHFICYNWDTSNYGYGGDKNSNGFILTTTPMTFNYQDENKVAKLSSYNGSIITIKNEKQYIRFQFLLSQMHKPSTDNMGGLNTGGFLADVDPEFEWILTMKLYGIE